MLFFLFVFALIIFVYIAATQPYIVKYFLDGGFLMLEDK